MDIKKEIGTIFTPETLLIVSFSNISGGSDMKFNVGRSEPTYIPMHTYDEKIIKLAKKKIKEEGFFPRMKIEKINKKSIIVKVLDDCYRHLEYYVEGTQNGINDKGLSYRISFVKNKHLKFI